MIEFTLRDNGSGNPQASTDYDSVMAQLETLVHRAANRAQTARLQDTDDDEKKPTRSSSSSHSRKNNSKDGRQDLQDLRDRVKQLKKETRDVFRRNPQPFKDTVGDTLFKSKSPENYHQYMRIPLSWYQEIQHVHYGSDTPYHDAIQLLGYIVFCYRLDRAIPQLLLRIRPHEIEAFLGIKKDRMLRAFRHLEDKQLIERLVIKGVVPWYPRDDRTSGSYRFILPFPDRLREITYDISARFTRLPGK